MNLPYILITSFKVAIFITFILLLVYLVVTLFLYLMRAYDEEFDKQKKFFYRLFHKNQKFKVLKFYTEGSNIDVEDGGFIVSLSLDYRNSVILHHLIKKNPNIEISFIGVVNKKTMKVVYVKGFLLKKNKEDSHDRKED